MQKRPITPHNEMSQTSRFVQLINDRNMMSEFLINDRNMMSEFLIIEQNEMSEFLYR